MAMNMPPGGAAGRGGDRAFGISWLKTAAAQLLEAVLTLLLVAAIVSVLFTSWPDNPYAQRYQAWLGRYLANAVHGLVWILIVGSLVAGGIGGLHYLTSHHEHGKRLLLGGLMGLLVAIALWLTLGWFPQLARGSFV
jgi:hypothetical protein